MVEKVNGVSFEQISAVYGGAMINKLCERANLNREQLFDAVKNEWSKPKKTILVQGRISLQAREGVEKVFDKGVQLVSGFARVDVVVVNQQGMSNVLEVGWNNEKQEVSIEGAKRCPPNEVRGMRLSPEVTATFLTGWLR